MMPAPILLVSPAVDLKGLQTHAADRIDVEQEKEPFSLGSVQVGRLVVVGTGIRAWRCGCGLCKGLGTIP